MASKKSRDLLLYTDTSRSSDALYFGQVEMHDPFIAFALRGKKYTVVSALEFGRVKRTSDFDVVLPLERAQEAARAAYPGEDATPARVISALLKELGAGTMVVPEDFPAGLFLELGKLGVALEIATGPLFAEREVKTPAEAALIREGNRCSAAGIAAAAKLLKSAKVSRGRLLVGGKALTSERLKVAIETACLEAGAVSLSTIAAGGDQACDPHDRGSGPLRAHQLIVVDVFPRVTASGFFGDMTRTFLRGRASDAQRQLVAAVRTAQLAALKTIRSGIPANAVHRAVTDTFARLGYETKHTANGSVGFFHGTGHGLGLDIHEAPRMNATSDRPLKRGTVVSVEPGLYYPGLGGCRIEDIVQVTPSGPLMLSRSPYEWEFN